MIPLPMLGALPWRLIGWAAVVAAVALAGWRVSAWHAAYERLGEVEAALDAEVQCGEGSACAARQAALQAAAEAKSKEVVADYEKELADLRNRPAVRRVIRVCPDSGNVQSPGTPGRTDAGTPAEGVVHGATEFDTRPLRDLASRADELSAQCRALIRWNEALAAD